MKTEIKIVLKNFSLKSIKMKQIFNLIKNFLKKHSSILSNIAKQNLIKINLQLLSSIFLIFKFELILILNKNKIRKYNDKNSINVDITDNNCIFFQQKKYLKH